MTQAIPKHEYSNKALSSNSPAIFQGTPELTILLINVNASLRSTDRKSIQLKVTIVKE
jgi:hypothetical protein